MAPREDPGGKALVTKDLAASGQLIAYGFTLGGGLAGHIGESIEEPLPTFMPYFAVFPFAWAIDGDATKAYCTTRFLQGSRDAARRAAVGVAQKRADAQLGRTATDEEVRQQTGWDVRFDGACGAFTWIGVYLGKPASFKPSATIDDKELRREFASFGSVGLISAPVAFFSVFAGATLWSVENKDKPNEQAATFTFGAGTNLDLLVAVLK